MVSSQSSLGNAKTAVLPRAPEIKAGDSHQLTAGLGREEPSAVLSPVLSETVRTLTAAMLTEVRCDVTKVKCIDRCLGAQRGGASGDKSSSGAGEDGRDEGGICKVGMVPGYCLWWLRWR